MATDIMLTRALLAGVSQGVLPEKAYTVPTDGGRPNPTPEFLEAFLEQTDSSVVEQLRIADEGSPARDLIDRLRERRLLRQTETVALHRDQERLDPVRRSRLLDPEQFTLTDTDAIEDKIAAELNLERHLVAVYIDRWSNPTYRRPGGGGKSRVQLADGSRTTFLDLESEVFRPELGEEQAYLHLYMPETSEDVQDKARELLWQSLRSV